MSLTFANFKQVIPSQILTRGREYLKQGAITDLSFDEEEMLWEAQVQGSDQYEVRVELTPDFTLNCSCDCPYDGGEYCKHVAAVLYMIEENFPEQTGTKPRKKPAARKTRHDKLRLQLEKATREQLAAILLEITQSDRELLNKVLIYLDGGTLKPTDYRRVVKDALRAEPGEYGYLDYSATNRAARKLRDLLKQADQWRSDGESDKAISLYQAVIDETVPIFDKTDDSSGGLGDCLNAALEALPEAAAMQGESGREALFAYCLERGRKKEFNDWDWGWDLLDLAGALVMTPAERATFTAALDELEAAMPRPRISDFIGNFNVARIARLRLDSIDRFDGKEAAYRFLRAHADLDDMRMELIKRYIEEGALDEAERQIEAGIAASNRRRLPGLTQQYEALRVTLLEQKGDTTGVIAGARALWLDGRGHEAHFETFKRLVPAAEWPAFVEGLLKDIHFPVQRAWLLAEEERWQDVLTLVQTHSEGDWLIQAYRTRLEERFPAEVGALYEQYVINMLRSGATRTEYKNTVAYLRQMIKIGQAERAQALAQRLRAQYANRPAFLEELAKL